MKNWLYAFVFIVICYVSLHGGVYLFWGIAPNATALPWDISATLVLGGMLFIFARNLNWFVLLFTSLLSVLQISNAAKLQFFGSPIMPDDFVSVRNLFMLFEGWQFISIVLITLGLTLLFWLVIRWRSWITWLVLAFLASTIWLVSLNSGLIIQLLDNKFGNVIWNQRGNFENRGLLIHLGQEWVRQVDRSTDYPTAQQVNAALSVVANTDSAAPLKHQTATAARNIHVIVLESFWDPLLLEQAKIKPDPLDPRFRQLWQQGGFAHALVPVWGGRTANAEFELLCGFPVLRDNVIFEGWLNNHAPCLPEYLKTRGYKTFVSHPNFAAFWNRINSYRRLGFETYWSKSDFQMDDMNRNILSDVSLYNQTHNKLKGYIQNKQPIFNYVLTFLGHYPYALNDKRPAIVTTKNSDSLIDAYANTIHYKSRELMDYLEQLRAQDPSAVIVLFGDHLPYLGSNFAGFTESGLLSDDVSTFSEEMFGTYVRTPLIIIDGERGPVISGDLPLYSLPKTILTLLSLPVPDMLDMTTQPEGILIRPLTNMYFVEKKNRRYICRDDKSDPVECSTSDDWLDAVKILSDDIFRGDQLALKRKNS